jgi:hypothetical protein
LNFTLTLALSRQALYQKSKIPPTFGTTTTFVPKVVCSDILPITQLYSNNWGMWGRMMKQGICSSPASKQQDDVVNLHHLQLVVKGDSYGCHHHYHFVRTGNRVSIFRSTHYHFKRRLPITIFFRFLPPVKAYRRALGAIGKLSPASIENEKIVEHKGTNKITKYNSLTKSDTGFQDLLKILTERHHSFEDSEDIERCDEIRIMRTSTKVDVDLSQFPIWLAKIFAATPPEIPKELQNLPQETEWLITLANGKQLDRIVYGEGSIPPIKSFFDAADDWLRMRLSYYVVSMVGIWLVLTLLVIIFANLR